MMADGNLYPLAAPPPGPPAQEWRKQSFDLAVESTKQLITVATGVVTITIVFSKDLDPVPRYLALAAWIVLTLSILCGAFALFNMSGVLHSASMGRVATPQIDAKGIPFFQVGQIGGFLLGIILVIVFGFFAATQKAKHPDEKQITNNSVQCPGTEKVDDKPPGKPQPAKNPTTTRHRRHHRFLCPCAGK